MSCHRQISAATLRLLIGGLKSPPNKLPKCHFSLLELIPGRGFSCEGYATKCSYPIVHCPHHTNYESDFNQTYELHELQQPQGLWNCELPLLGLRFVDFVGLSASEQQTLPFKAGANRPQNWSDMYRKCNPSTRMRRCWSEAATWTTWTRCRRWIDSPVLKCFARHKRIQKKRGSLLQKQDEIVYIDHMICSEK